MTKKQTPYQSDAVAAIQLSAEEREAAKALLAERPKVVPGTRAIVSQTEATAWYSKVTAKMQELGITGKKVAAFCDLAGVPD